MVRFESSGNVRPSGAEEPLNPLVCEHINRYVDWVLMLYLQSGEQGQGPSVVLSMELPQFV